MGVRWTEKDLERVADRVRRDEETVRLAANRTRTILARRKNRGTSKYGAKGTTVDGKRFPSRLEADRYRELVALQAAGVVDWFIRHPRFDLPGGVKYEADFLVVWHHPYPVNDTAHSKAVSVEDCKGVETPVFKIKRRQMAECHPNVSLRLLTRKDVRRG